MTVESANFITQLNQDYPEHSATISKNLAQHINLLKTVLLNTMPYGENVGFSSAHINRLRDLTSNFQSQLNTRDYDKRLMSDNATLDIRGMSGNISPEIAALSSNFEPTINDVSANAQTDIENVSAGTDANIKAMSANLATNVDTMSASMMVEIQVLSSTINAQKLSVSGTAADTVRVNGWRLFVQTATPAGYADGDLWFRPKEEISAS